MSHRSRTVLSLYPFVFSFYAVLESVKALNVSEESVGAVPCIEQPELRGGSCPPCPRSSQLSVWLRLRCCRPPRPTAGSSRSPPETPAPPWSRQPCSRSSPLRRRARPCCRPAGSEPWRWGPGPPLAAAWCFPPAGGAGRCCEVARGGDIREVDVRWQVFSAATRNGRWDQLWWKHRCPKNIVCPVKGLWKLILMFLEIQWGSLCHHFSHYQTIDGNVFSDVKLCCFSLPNNKLNICVYGTVGQTKDIWRRHLGV